MGLGTSIFLIAVGAILRFAVNVTTKGFNIQTVGLILMIVGGVGLLLWLLWITVWADHRNRTVVADDRALPPDRYRDPAYRDPAHRDPAYRDPTYRERV
jgi:hypothetical protein